MLRLPAALLLLLLSSPLSAEPIPQIGRVTLLDLESDCLPCDLQDRIVHRVEKEFADRVAFIYLDVEKETWAKEKYGISVLPTLIFFDKKGQEAFRTTGYMKEGTMKDRLNTLLHE